MPGEKEESPHISFDAKSLPQSSEAAPDSSRSPSQKQEGSATSGYDRESSDGKGKQNASPPPAISSTTTTATTPPSSPRTASTSSPSRSHLSSPRAALHAAAAASSATAGTNNETDDNDDKDTTKESQTIGEESAAPSTVGAAAVSSEANEQIPAGVIQQYSGSDIALTSPDSVVSIKILVSNNVAGSIIGRSGQSISELQVQSSSRIKLSQSGDFYPGTSDRVCLIQGDQQQVRIASSMIMQRIHELQRQAEQRNQQQAQAAQQQQQQQQHFQYQSPYQEISNSSGNNEANPSGGFIVRVLVPTPACGMIIGRGGANIKTMAETSGVSSIRLSPKEFDGPSILGGNIGHGAQQPVVGAGAIVAATGERIVTVSGPNLSSTISCVGLIIDGIATHPEIGRYSNMTTSYTRASSTISAAASASVNRGSGPFYAPVGPYGLARPTSIAPLGSSSNMAGSSPSNLAMSPPSPLIQGQPITPQHHIQGDPSPYHGSMDALGSSQHHQSFRYPQITGSGNDPASQSPYPSPHSQPPPSHQMMYTGSPATPIPTLQSPYGSVSPQQAHPGQAPYDHHGGQRASMYSPVGGRSRSSISRGSSHDDVGPIPPADQLAGMQIAGQSPIRSSGETEVVPDVTQRLPQGSTIQMSIPDALIGAVLGRGGQTLNELQVSTSTRIKISQRGVYVPGTTNRVVTITGPSGDTVATAQYLINQRLVRSNAARREQQQQQQQQQQDTNRRRGSSSVGEGGTSSSGQY